MANSQLKRKRNFILCAIALACLCVMSFVLGFTLLSHRKDAFTSQIETTIGDQTRDGHRQFTFGKTYTIGGKQYKIGEGEDETIDFYTALGLTPEEYTVELTKFTYKDGTDGTDENTSLRNAGLYEFEITPTAADGEAYVDTIAMEQGELVLDVSKFGAFVNARGAQQYEAHGDITTIYQHNNGWYSVQLDDQVTVGTRTITNAYYFHDSTLKAVKLYDEVLYDANGAPWQSTIENGALNPVEAAQSTYKYYYTDDDYVDFTITNRTGTQFADSGEYVASYTITVNPNINIVYQDSLLSDKYKGLSIPEKSRGEHSFVLAKYWYIVNQSDYIKQWGYANGNEPFVPFSTGGRISDNGGYTAVDTVTYGQAIQVNEPHYTVSGTNDSISFYIEYEPTDGSFKDTITGASPRPFEHAYTAAGKDYDWTWTKNTGATAENTIEYYINSSMPAGTYTLYLVVNYTSNNTNAPAKITGEYKLYVLPGELDGAAVEGILEAIQNGKNYYALDSVTGKATQLHDDISAEDGVKEILEKTLNTNRSGDNYWTQLSEELKAKYYDTEVTILYNRDGQPITYYVSEADMLADMASTGSFSFYFSISAKNYVTKGGADDADRKTYTFTTIYHNAITEIYDQIRARDPYFKAVTYTGSAVHTSVPNSAIYSYTFGPDDNYINVTDDATVTLTIYDGSRLLWGWADIPDDLKEAGIVTYAKTEDGSDDFYSLVVKFSIVNATNSWTTAPQMSPWLYNSFNSSVNVIKSEPRFKEEGMTIYYRVGVAGERTGSDTDGLTWIYDGSKYSWLSVDGSFAVLNDNTDAAFFTVNANGQVSNEIAQKFTLLRVGEYVLDSYVGTIANVNEYHTAADASTSLSMITVMRAYNSWKNPPSVTSWVYTNFADTNFTYAVPALTDGGVVKYTLYEGDVDGGTQLITFEKLTDTSATVEGLNGAANVSAYLKALPVKSLYTIVASFEGTADYYDWSSSVTFSVSQATNNWMTYPQISGWKYNEFDSSNSFKKGSANFGTEGVDTTEYTVQYIGSNDAVVEGEYLGKSETLTYDELLEVLAGLSATSKYGSGRYNLRIVVPATNNYFAAEPRNLPFTVSKADNTWATADPSIAGWVYGLYDGEGANKPSEARATVDTGHATEYKYYSAKYENGQWDSMQEYQVSELTYAPVGSYILVVTVPGNENYNALVAIVPFSITINDNNWKGDAPEATLEWTWGYKDYDPANSTLANATAIYGKEIKYTILNTDKNQSQPVTVANSAEGREELIQTLRGLAAGNYTITVTVEATDDYRLLQNIVTVKVHVAQFHIDDEDKPSSEGWVWNAADENKKFKDIVIDDETTVLESDVVNKSYRFGINGSWSDNFDSAENMMKELKTRDAGTYTVEITLSCDNYESKVITAEVVITKVSNAWIGELKNYTDDGSGKVDLGTFSIPSATYHEIELAGGTKVDVLRFDIIPFSGTPQYSLTLEAFKTALTSLPVGSGSYTIYARVGGTGYVVGSDSDLAAAVERYNANYVALEAQSCFVTLQKIENPWKSGWLIGAQDEESISWTWGNNDYVDGLLEKKPQATYSNETMVYTIRQGGTVIATFTSTGSGKTEAMEGYYGSSAEAYAALLARLKTLDASSYTMTALIAATDYCLATELLTAPFEILKVKPEWDEATTKANGTSYSWNRGQGGTEADKIKQPVLDTAFSDWGQTWRYSVVKDGVSQPYDDWSSVIGVFKADAVGSYVVTVTIPSGVNHEELRYTFSVVIIAAGNTWTSDVGEPEDLLEWTWGWAKDDPTASKFFKAKAAYADDGITYSILNTDTNRSQGSVIAYNDDATRTELLNALKALGVGNYAITVSVKATDSYGEVSKTVIVKVYAAKFEIASEPASAGWTWGSYQEDTAFTDVGKITTVLESDTPVKSYRIGNNGSWSDPYDSVTAMLAVLKDYNAGTYSVELTIKCDNYETVTYTVEVVIKKIANKWTQEFGQFTDNGSGKVEVEDTWYPKATIEEITIEGSKPVKVLRFDIVPTNGVPQYNLDFEAFKAALGKLTVGSYTIYARVGGTGYMGATGDLATAVAAYNLNYEALDVISCVISLGKLANDWNTKLTAGLEWTWGDDLSGVEGLVKPVAENLDETAVYTIRQGSSTLFNSAEGEYENSTAAWAALLEALKGLDAGTYTITASVAGTMIYNAAPTLSETFEIKQVTTAWDKDTEATNGKSTSWEYGKGEVEAVKLKAPVVGTSGSALGNWDTTSKDAVTYAITKNGSSTTYDDWDKIIGALKEAAAGTYTVTVTIKGDANHTALTYSYTVTVTSTENAWVGTAPENTLEWTWGYKDKDPANSALANAKAKYGESITYSIRKTDGSWSDVKTVTDEATRGELKKALQELVVGSYTITVTVAATSDYAQLQVIVSVTVSAAKFEIASEPASAGWTWGSYSEGTAFTDVGKITTVLESDTPVKSYRIGDSVTSYGSVAEMLAVLKDYNAGTYSVEVTIKCDNYETVTYTVEVVIKKIANQWTQEFGQFTDNGSGKVEVEDTWYPKATIEEITIEGSKPVKVLRFDIVPMSGTPQYNLDFEAFKAALGEIVAGTYTLYARVGGTGYMGATGDLATAVAAYNLNYEALDVISCVISLGKLANGWQSEFEGNVNWTWGDNQFVDSLVDHRPVAKHEDDMAEYSVRQNGGTLRTFSAATYEATEKSSKAELAWLALLDYVKTLDAGTYTITANVAATNEYLAAGQIAETFEIKQVTTAWDKDTEATNGKSTSWKYGEGEAEAVKLKAPVVGTSGTYLNGWDTTMKYSITKSGSVQSYVDWDKIIETLQKAAAGTYTVTVSIDGDKNHTALTYIFTVTISVYDNEWEEGTTAAGPITWIYQSGDNTQIVFSPKYNKGNLTITVNGTVVEYSNLNSYLTELTPNPAAYSIIARVTADDMYGSLERSILLTVSKGEDKWDEEFKPEDSFGPDVKEGDGIEWEWNSDVLWQGIKVANSNSVSVEVYAVSAPNTVIRKFTYNPADATDFNGAVNRFNNELLPQLNVGKYFLLVTTTAEGDWKALETKIYFTITQAANNWKSEPEFKGDNIKAEGKNYEWTYGDDVSPFADAKYGAFKVTYYVKNAVARATGWTQINGLPTGAGEYKAVFSVDGTTNYVGIDGEGNWELTFTIKKADASKLGFDKYPSVTGWSWHGYSVTSNLFTGRPASGGAVWFEIRDTNGNTVLIEKFQLVNASGGHTDIYEDIYAPEAGDVIQKLNALTAGMYTLRMYVIDETGNYEDFYEDTYFNVTAATNGWEKTPKIASWFSGGGYKASENSPVVEVRYGSYDVVITEKTPSGATGAEWYRASYRYDEENGTFTMTSLYNNLEAAQIGWYVMTVTVYEAAGKYNGLKEIVEFQVFPQGTLEAGNYWVTAPNILGWTANISGDVNMPSGEPARGKPYFEFYAAEWNGNEWVIVGDVIGAGEDSKRIEAGDNYFKDFYIPMKPGTYIMYAYAEDRSDNDGEYSMEWKYSVFTIYDRAIEWTQTVNIAPTLYLGDQDEWAFPSATANLDGSIITYRFFTEAGELLEDQTRIPSKEGNYYVEAYAEARYTGRIVSRAYFTVSRTRLLWERSASIAPTLYLGDVGDPTKWTYIEALISDSRVNITYEFFDALTNESLGFEIPRLEGSYYLQVIASAAHIVTLEEQLYFEVELSQNYWIGASPSIGSWSEESNDESPDPTGSVFKGEIEYTYARQSDPTKEFTEKPTKAGDYILYARVRVDGYKTLEATYMFTIEPAYNSTLLMIDVVLGSFACILAVVVIIFAVRRHREN